VLRNRSLLTAWCLLLWTASAAQAQARATDSGGIYSCTDARGRTITADRPIADCLDREQRELGPSGTVRRTIEPTYTAREQAERDERARQTSQQASRMAEERRRERALLMRYPTPETHDRERAQAMVQIDIVVQAAKKRLEELGIERRAIDDELEFYKKDPARAPASLRRKLDDNVHGIAVQNRFITAQDDEKGRVNARFDEERARLKALWAPNAGRSAAKPQ